MNNDNKQPISRIKVRLRTKFMIGIIILECLLMTAIILVVEKQMRQSTLDEFLKRGLSIAEHLAAVNSNNVSTYNYVNIEQSVEKIADLNGLIYATVLLFDGEVAAYSGRNDIRGKVLGNGLHERALQSTKTLVQYGNLGGPGDEVCEIAAPILLKGDKWGTVRIGLSLKEMNAAIGKTRQLLLVLGLIGLAAGCLGSLLFARRITRPIGALVDSVESVSNGDFGRPVEIKTNDEIGFLGKRLDSMKEGLKELELFQSNKRLQSLFQVSRAMNSFQNLEKLYQVILEAALNATEGFAGSLTLLDSDKKARIVAIAENGNLEEHSFEHAKKAFGTSSFNEYEMLLSNPGYNRPLLLQMDLGQQEVPVLAMRLESNPEVEMLVVPLQQSETTMGFINLLRKSRNGKVHASETQTLSVLASYGTAAIENRQLFVQLEQSYLSSINSLAKSLEFKDEYTHGHSERVAKICVKAGMKMDMDEKSLRVLHNAALLHDMGKIGVVESILNKNSTVNPEEWSKIRKHPEYGEEILKPILSLSEEIKIVRHHHEREDGKGYPDGLTGDQLSLSEKIMIVADAYDAMNSNRAYRLPLEPDTIREELLANKGSQFDPVVVDVLLEIMEEEADTTLKAIHSHKVIPFPKVACVSE
jgi:HD-GYP domain-containing protein (c-di-GMP phosphodiesterase class II)/HAMP domain-containing protein